MDDGIAIRVVRKLFFRAATMLNSRWTDIGNLVTPLKGHPFSDKGKFLNAFSSRRKALLGSGLCMTTSLQRFLLACIVSQPSSYLELPDLTCEDSKFNLNEHERDYVQQATEIYEKTRVKTAEDKPKPESILMVVEDLPIRQSQSHLMVVRLHLEQI